MSFTLTTFRSVMECHAKVMESAMLSQNTNNSQLMKEAIQHLDEVVFKAIQAAKEVTDEVN